MLTDELLSNMCIILSSNEERTQTGPSAEFGKSSRMASIMISSFSMISVKNNDFFMPVLGS